MKYLVDLLPVKARKYLYAIFSAAIAIYGVGQATEGDWTQFAVSLASTFVGTMAAANTNTSAPESTSGEDTE